jgi:hypothetical protein
VAYKTFISYKYSEARQLRNRIVEALGEDARYYQGETSVSPDMSDRTTEYIKEKLKDMIYSTSVTIVVISPNMKESNWIDWEIEYSLKQIKRGDKTSGTNGVMGVVMKYNGGYGWLRTTISNQDGHSSTQTNTNYLYDIINNNRFNQEPKEYFCEICKTSDPLKGSYLSLVTEEVFLKDPSLYIENAYNKSKNLIRYKINKSR